MEPTLTKKNDIIFQNGKVEKKGLRFESYIGSSFTKQLGCKNFYKGIDYSIHEEIWTIFHTIIKNEINFEPEKAKEIVDKLIKYNENENKLLLNFQDPKYASSHSESKTDKTDTLSSENANSSENNANINTINNEKNDKKDNQQNININNIDSEKEKKEKRREKKGKKREKKEKKMKKKQLLPENEEERKIMDEIKKNKDIDGDFDIIIPNVEREKFNMIINNFYYGNKSNSCFIFGKKTLNELPEVFHLFIEVGLNVFQDEIKYKSFQINKYISIVNLVNEIGNEDIKNKYKDNWRTRLNLNENLGENKIIADKYVYMLISNSEYGAFSYRFLDKKNYESEDDTKDKKEYKKLLPEDSEEFLFCGYVDFEKEINGIRGLNIKMEKQKENFETEIGKQKEAMEKTMELKIEAQKKDMEAQKKALELKIEAQKNNMEAQKKALELKIEEQKMDMEAQKIAFEREIELLKNEINDLKNENKKNNSDEIRNKDSKK